MSTTLPTLSSSEQIKQPRSGNMPSDWSLSGLGECGEIVMGQSPPGASYNKVGFGTALINGPTEFTDDYPIKIQWTSQPTRFCKPGDLLICVRGSSTGRTNYADDTYAIGRGVAAIRAKGDNNTQFLSYQVIAGVSELLASATGSTFPSVDGKTFRGIVVPLPPPAEQRAIATALSDADELIGALDKLIAKKRAIKLATMQQLLTGKTRLPGFTGESGSQLTDVGVIPSDWSVSTLGQMCSFENGDRGTNYPSERDFVPSGVPFVNAGHLSHGRVTTISLDYITRQRFDLLGSGKFAPGDILFCLRGTLGKFGVVDANLREGAIASSLVIVRTRTNLLRREYLRWYLDSAVCRQMIEKWAGGAAQPNLGAQDLARFIIPLPSSAEEQHAIVIILSDMDAEITALEQRRDKTKAIKQGMMQSLLTGRVRLVTP